jgi:hypothetical protein
MADFDSIKREATKLERLLEEKVARYQQVCIFLRDLVDFCTGVCRSLNS